VNARQASGPVVSRTPSLSTTPPLNRILLLVLSLLVAAGCIMAGVWQLSRLREKRADNAIRRERLAQPAVDLTSSGTSDTVARFRRVRASGRLDYEREVALTSQSFRGSPGVWLITPLTRAGTDTLVLVARGWVYSPDAATTDFPRWREADSVTLEGYALPFPAPRADTDSSSLAPRAVRRLDHARLTERMGAPIAGYYVVMTSGAGRGDSIPNRLPPPVLTDGPHLSYAVQWFLFATIFGAGGTIVVLRGRRFASGSGGGGGGGGGGERGRGVR
jgi:surfeit locus 1 family protein